jgi:hypothetical protein
MVEGRNALLVPPGDSAALAARVRQVIESDETIERLGRAGRETVEQSGNIASFATGVAHACERATVDSPISP